MPGMKKMMYGMGGSNMKYGKGGAKMMKGYKDGGQALFNALKKKGYKKMGGSMMGNSALESSMNGMMYKHGGSCGRKIMGKNLRKK
tara:strand:- start:1004 stop:1261 length:258 start_codon:yes stop_codon:yes gene_type:complete